MLDTLINGGQLKLLYETFTPSWDNPTAEKEMEAALTKYHNDVQIAYVANDGMAGTVIQALKAQGLVGKVLVTGQDATVAGIQDILLGYQSMTVYKAIPKEAGATAQIVADLSKGVDTSSLTNGATIATSDGGWIRHPCSKRRSRSTRPTSRAPCWPTATSRRGHLPGRAGRHRRHLLVSAL